MSAPTDQYRVVAQNRRARFDYEIVETLEVGIILMGSEVKSLRLGTSSINEAFAGEMEGEIFLFNANIPEYLEANRFNHEPKRPRKLLMKKRQLNKFLGAIRRKGLTLIPIKLYFNAKGRAKLELGLGKGKKTVDKRNTIKDRDWQRDKARVMRDKG
ncbi:MAG: SsrA-binding protein SmpB [Alphaproteobacteria bacterium]|jgi:SsrA-binding protein|nr:SsrA-binding protein SmpB [Alphaproteobacteria bacterium]